MPHEHKNQSCLPLLFHPLGWHHLKKKMEKSLPAVDPIISMPKSSAPTEKAIALADRCAANSFNP